MKLNRLVITTVLTGLIAAPVYAATPYCIAVNGGFGNGGTSFVARNYTMPDPSKCTAWTGYTKTASTVILTTSGTACASDDGNVLTVSVFSADPPFVGTTPVADYIQECPSSATSCPLGSGQDSGYFSGAAAEQNCTDALLDLPVLHD
jgi:hypothetical protein